MQMHFGAGLAQGWAALAAGTVAAWRALAAAGGGHASGAQRALGLGIWLLAGGLAAGLLGLRRRRTRAARAQANERQTVRQAQRLYRRFQRCLRRAGIARAPAQTGDELLLALAAARPGSALLAAAREFIATYQAARFGPAATEALRRLPGHLQRVRRAA